MTKEEQLYTYGKDLVDALSPIVNLKYDDFQKTLLAEFSVDKQDQVLLTLQQLLPVSWDAKSIKKAPDEIKHLAGDFSKLIKNQKLLSIGQDKQQNLMAVWWPWGHGATVSVRIFLTNTSPYVAKTGFFHRMKNLFA